ncbi:MAG: glycosyltransferase, partial [Acetobacteraceae bacterium]
MAGTLAAASGLGEAARMTLAACRALDLPTWPIDVSPSFPGTRPVALPPGTGNLPPAGVPLIWHVNAPHLAWASLAVPRALVSRRRVVGFWFWEGERLPSDWRKGFRFVHEVWTGSRFSAAAIARDFPGTVRVVPLPLAKAPPRPAPLSRAELGLPEDAVVVLVSFNLASSCVRKNPEGAIAAFRRAFGDRTDRLLLLRIGNPDAFPEDFRWIGSMAAGAPNIRIDTRPLPTAECHAITAASDIVLSLHRAEGFGLVPAEAMLLGKPVVATGWSGNLDFMDEESAALVPYRLVEARDPRGIYAVPGTRWAEPAA